VADVADGVNERFDFTEPVPPATDLGPVHFIAIGGTGVSAVARLFLRLGVPVSGSDAADSAGLRELERLGARVFVGHDAEHLGDAATVVVSSAITEANPELAGARARGLRVLHRAQALAACLAGREAVAVAGANGKTTTTSMLVWALVGAGLDPSYASGAEIVGLGTNASIGAGTAFVVEADESDGSFLAYRPEHCVVMNVQPDHLDFYGSFERVEAAYSAFAASRRPGGLLIACADDEGSARLASADGGEVVTFGVDANADVRLEPVRDAFADAGAFGSEAILLDSGVRRPLALRLPGRHNLLDAAAAYTAAVRGFGADPDRVLAALSEFGGARRRFEPRGRAGGVLVIDDYAHNPGKVAALVGTVADIVGPDRVHVVFQPHLYSRTRDGAAGFAAGLARAGDVVLLPVYGAREQPMEGVTSALIADRIPALDPDARVELVDDPAVAVAGIVERARPGDIVLVVGAGDVTRLCEPILSGLAVR
jgi:UDP-N-acetylmuramate--alanine ligase